MSTGLLTEKELRVNHSVPRALFTPFDAKAAALLKGGRVCTSPNHDTIYEPHVGVTTVSLFSDFRHGPDDYLLWPQWHTQDFPFLAAIPRQETAPKHLLCMWQGVTKDDFIPLSGVLTDGLGRLSQPRITEVMARRNEIRSRVLEYKVKAKNPYIAVTAVDRSMYHASERFIGLPATLSQIQYFVAVFQRYFLELLAILNYLEIYEPRLNGLLPTATETAKTMGAFTDDARVVQDFFTAGLPIFFVRQAGPFKTPGYCFIQTVVTARDSSHLCTSPCSPPFPAIFSGEATDSRKYCAIHRSIRSWQVLPEPCEDQGTSSGPASSTSSNPTQQATAASMSRGSEKPQKKSKYQKPSQPPTKFQVLSKPMAPFPIPAWSRALTNIDQSPSRNTKGHPAALYMFPDPSLLCSDGQQLRTKNCESWVRMRPNWLMLLSLKPSAALSKQSWRDFLVVDPSGDWWNKTGSTAEAKRRQRMRDLLAPQTIDNFFFAGIQTRSTTGEAMVWQGKEYVAGQEPPLPVFREIIWELCERIFRYELIMLDRRACANLTFSDSDTDQLFDRQELISKCFVDSLFDVVSIPSTNVGLAADHFRARLPYVLALVAVMKGWKGEKPATFSLASTPVFEFSESRALDLEEDAACLYTQTFFDHFGRAPPIPYRLHSA